MSHPDPMNDPENTLPTDMTEEEQERERIAKEDDEERKTEQFLDDQRM